MKIRLLMPVFTGMVLLFVSAATGQSLPAPGASEALASGVTRNTGTQQETTDGNADAQKAAPNGELRHVQIGRHYPDDPHSHDDPHTWHVGVGLAAVKIKGEQGVMPGYHFHLSRQLGSHHQWGAGVGWEMIPGDHSHHGLNLLLSSRLFPFLTLTAGPGVAITRHEGHQEILPAFHSELLAEFNVGKIHMGPMAGFGFDSEEHHFSLGWHIGLGF
jgi:hypothetical protein